MSPHSPELLTITRLQPWTRESFLAFCTDVGLGGIGPAEGDAEDIRDADNNTVTFGILRGTIIATVRTKLDAFLATEPQTKIRWYDGSGWYIYRSEEFVADTGNEPRL